MTVQLVDQEGSQLPKLKGRNHRSIPRLMPCVDWMFPLKPETNPISICNVESERDGVMRRSRRDEMVSVYRNE